MFTHNTTPTGIGATQKLTTEFASNIGTEKERCQVNLSLIEPKDNQVSSLGLHEFLQIKTPHIKWIQRIFADYEFIEPRDFKTNLSESTGGRPSFDYLLSVHTAKEICMIAKSARGKEARKYYIQCEEKLKDINSEVKKSEPTPQPTKLSTAQLIQQCVELISDLENEVLVLKPKAQFYDVVLSSDKYLTMDEVAKILNLGFGRNKLFSVLRERGYLRYNNVAYQQFIDRGLFKLRETTKIDRFGNAHVSVQTLVSQKGLDVLQRELVGSEVRMLETLNESWV